MPGSCEQQENNDCDSVITMIPRWDQQGVASPTGAKPSISRIARDFAPT
jgi:hypothetical protein